NPALARMFGYASPEELIASVGDIGRQVYADPDQGRHFFRQLTDAGVVYRFEVEVLRKDGSRFWITQNGRAVRDDAGDVVHFEGTMEDITERKRAEEALRASEERYRLLFERNLAGVVVSTPEGRVLDCNDALVRMLGCDSREEIL